MMHQALAITLIEDAVFSARSATEGGHESLDRIPGATLLGAAAAKLYAKLDSTSAFTAFHSGLLSFGDGLPYSGDSVAYPVPLSWHHAKSEQPELTIATADSKVFDFPHCQPNNTGNSGIESLRKLYGHKIYNFQHCRRIDAVEGLTEPQPKQLRAGFVRPGDGAWLKPKHELRLKTAIDPATGRAAEGQLFGYDALARGQTFATRIEADDDLDPALFERVIDALTGPLLLGRSRSAEYGRAEARPISLAPPPLGASQGDLLTLWLLSDLAPTDRFGQQTLMLDHQSLGLPDAEIMYGQSFLRTRRWSPWNGARQGYDRERLVLSAGGVITLKLERDLTPEETDRLCAGIGLHREAGLGRLWINPPLLAGKHPHFADLKSVKPAMPRIAPQRPNDPLIAWLEDQSGDWKTEAEQTALQLADDYRKLMQRARQAAGVVTELSFGPSKSQWGRVLEAARERDGQALFDTLFNGDSAIVKSTGEGWDEEVPVKTGNWQRLADWLKERLTEQRTDRGYAHSVRRLARRIRDDIDKRRV